MAPPGSIYLIAEGVRRSVAARRFGLATLPAVVLAADGKHGPPFDVALDELYATKSRVPRTGDNGRYMRIEAGMADPVGRVSIPEIVLRVIPGRMAKYFIRLEDVVLDP